MATKTVLQHECDRCERVWYSDPAKEKHAETSIKIEAIIDGDLVAEVSFTALCEGCKGTVRSQIEAIGKEFKKASPVRKAKKKGDAKEKAAQDNSQSASSSTTHAAQTLAASGNGASPIHATRTAAQIVPPSTRR